VCVIILKVFAQLQQSRGRGCKILSTIFPADIRTHHATRQRHPIPTVPKATQRIRPVRQLSTHEHGGPPPGPTRVLSVVPVPAPVSRMPLARSLDATRLPTTCVSHMRQRSCPQRGRLLCLSTIKNSRIPADSKSIAVHPSPHTTRLN
jgi:hypothetical protein